MPYSTPDDVPTFGEILWIVGAILLVAFLPAVAIAALVVFLAVAIWDWYSYENDRDHDEDEL